MSNKEGLLFVVSAPAGTGKTTLIEKLASEFSRVLQSISFTTRKPRQGEKDGIHYHFVSKEEFQKKIDDHDFLEYVTLYGQYYGTSKSWVHDKLKEGKHVVLVIDTQGAMQLMGKLEAVYVFIEPPSLEVLKKRLMARKTESKEDLVARLDWAKHEMDFSRYYDYKVVNDDLKTAYEALRSIIIAEEHRAGLN